MKLLLSLCLFLASSHAWLQQDASTLFKAACTTYESGDYEKAFVQFESLIDSNYRSFELYFNAGDAAFKTNRVGKAILRFEQAKKIRPADADVVHNLKLLNALIIDKNENVTESPVEDQLFAYIGQSINFWAWTTLALFAVAILLFGLYRLAKNQRIQRLGMLLGSLVAIVAVVAFIIAHLYNNHLNSSNSGVVLAPSVTLKLEPSEESNDAFILHEGSQALIRQERDQWYEIAFSDEKIGWIRKADFEEI